MKKIIALLLAIISMFSALSLMACQEEPEVKDTNNVLFNGFENFEKDFLVMRVVNWDFGKVNIEYDKKFVKFGEASAKFNPASGLFGTGRPIIYIPTYSARYGYDYSDFTKTEKISAWFYNDQDEVKYVGLGLQIGQIINHDTLSCVGRTPAMRFALAPREWTYVEYELNPYYLNCNSSLDLSEVLGVYVQFDYVDQYRETSPDIYMDDFRFHLSDTPVVGEDFSLKSDAENGVWELADFEDERQFQFFTLGGLDKSEFERASIEVVSASSVGTTAKSGNNVLKITRRCCASSSKLQSVILTSEIIERAIKNIGQDALDNPQNYKFVVDFYNYSSVKQRAGFSYTANVATKSTPTWVYLGYVEPYSWGTFERTLDYFNTTLYDRITIEGEERKSTYPELKEEYKYLYDAATKLPAKEDTKWFTEFGGTINFSLSGMSADDRREKYFILDNIRIERVDTNQEGGAE